MSINHLLRGALELMKLETEVPRQANHDDRFKLSTMFACHRQMGRLPKSLRRSWNNAMTGTFLKLVR